MAKKCMVFETLGSVTEMAKQAGDNTNEIRLSGVFGVCGVRNNNRRIYSKENYGQMVEGLQREIMEAGVLGELEHPESMNINLNNVSHKIESVEMHEDGTVSGTIVLLNTDKGRNAKAIVEAGVPLYISSRALGSIDASGNVTLTSLKTYDLVGTPGFSQAKLEQLKESNMMIESLDDSCYAIIIDEGADGSKDEGNEPEDDKESKENKEKNQNKNTDMDDLKQSIDSLSKKIESLEATLHVTQESLEAKDKEIAILKEQLEENISCNYDAIEQWVSEEFAPDFKTDLVKRIAEGTQKYLDNEFTESIQKWTTEEYSEFVEAWIGKEFAPIIESWINSEFAPIVESWVNSEFAPIIEGWVTDEFGKTVDSWMTTEVKESITKELNENANAYFNEKFAKLNENKFDMIDKMLESIGTTSTSKEHLENVLNESQKNDTKFSNFFAVTNMPNEYRPLWEMLDDNRKNEIALTSRAYDFTKAGVLESFWAGIDFKKPSTQQVTESQKNVTPGSNLVSSVAKAMLKMRLGR